MQVMVEHWNATKDGPLTEDALRRKIESRGYRVNTFIYPPGTYFPMHSHLVDKVDGVVSGSFRVVVEEAEVMLGPGDMVYVPRNTRHTAEVVGKQPVISLDGVG